MDEMRDRRDAEWFWMHKTIIDDYGAKIGVHGIAIYAALAKYAAHDGTAIPSLRTLAKKLGIGTGTLQRYLDKLVDYKLIERRKRYSPDGDFTSTEYILLKIHNKSRGVSTVDTPVAITDTPVAITDTPVAIVDQGVYPQQIHGVSTVDTEQEDLNKKDLKQEKPFPPNPPSGGKRRRTKQAEEISPEAQIIIDALNTATGSNFRLPGEIQPCLTRGNTVEECLLVIAWCEAIWTKRFPEQEANFNTSTPFRKDNFDRYRAAAEKWHEQGRPAYSPYPGAATGVTLRSPTDADILSPD